MTKEAMKLALEALEDLGMKHYESTGEVLYKETFNALRQAIAEAEQAQPVAYVAQLIEALYENSDPVSVEAAEYLEKHTTPPQSKPLTVDEVWMNDVLMSLNAELGCSMDLLMEVVRAIEAAHGIKE